MLTRIGQPKYHVTCTICNWYPAPLCLAEHFFKQCFLLKQLYEIGPRLVMNTTINTLNSFLYLVWQNPVNPFQKKKTHQLNFIKFIKMFECLKDLKSGFDWVFCKMLLVAYCIVYFLEGYHLVSVLVVCVPCRPRWVLTSHHSLSNHFRTRNVDLGSFYHSHLKVGVFLLLLFLFLKDLLVWLFSTKTRGLD